MQNRWGNAIFQASGSRFYMLLYAQEGKPGIRSDATVYFFKASDLVATHEPLLAVWQGDGSEASSDKSLLGVIVEIDA